MSRTRHPSVLLVLLALLVSLLTLAPPGVPASAATRVAKEDCRRIDPNLVNGVCLRYRTPRGSGLTWIGSYRAPNGRVFFCIDFLYDSRLPRRAERVSTDDLVNQLGDAVGDDEVAALNYVVSRWAGDGSTGSDERDAAIALLVREVMGDGRAPGGVQVYPAGLAVGGVVRPPVGGLDGRVVDLASAMWGAASRYRGPYTLAVGLRRPGRVVRLGQVRGFRLEVLSATGRRVPGVDVELSCTGPVRCPSSVTTRRRPSLIWVRPSDVGRFRLLALAEGPASDGLLRQQRGWRTHGGRAARPAGVQRAWIARRNQTEATVAARARIRRSAPVLTTVASRQLALVGQQLHDRVLVEGLAGLPTVLTWTLRGPVAPVDGGCAGLDWTSAPVADSGTMTVAADGVHLTPATQVSVAGCYTYEQALAGTELSRAALSPPGLEAETALVTRRLPVVTTAVSDERALVGARLHDTIAVSGLGAATPVVVRWWLLGPVAPRGGSSCRDLDWTTARRVDSGELTARRNGRFRTRGVEVGAPGCYTYRTLVPATAATERLELPPGDPAETAIVTRPVVPYVPEAPTGWAGPSGRSGPAGVLRLDPVAPVAPEGDTFRPSVKALPRYLWREYVAPRRGSLAGELRVDRVGVRVSVRSVGLDDGVIAVPRDRRSVGWLSTTAAPGDVTGSSVLSGHVSDVRGGLGALRRVRLGDVVRWGSERFVVTGVRRHPRRGGLPAGLFRTDGQRLLHLVTCSGLRRGRGNRTYYVDNLVVTARLTSG